MSGDPRVPCPKHWLSVSDQLVKLQSRGLTIADPSLAAEFLRHINYYSFAGYGLAFENPRHCYPSGTTFEQIRQAYEFDRVLRDLCTESIELIELDLRANLAHSFGENHGPFGHVDLSHFYDTSRHAEWLRKLREETDRSSDLFIAHHRTKYNEFPDVPIWVATEVMSFGSLSNFYRTLHKQDQKRVSLRYGVQPQTLRSWIHHLVYVRNLCAHHARLWDRVWSIKPDLPAGHHWSAPLLPDNTQLFVSLLIQSKMLHGIAAEQAFACEWRQRVRGLIDERRPDCPDSLQKMGLTGEWCNHPQW